MKVSVIQMNMKLAEPDYNYLKAEELTRIAAREKPDTIVLPETWNTGFFPIDNRSELADENGLRTKILFSKLSKELNVNIIAGSVVNKKNNSLYNTSYIFDRSGQCISEYDKTHLYSLMHEDYYFVKGNKVTVFEIDNVKCGIIICYDIRFMELVRTLALQGIKILFVVAQWPLVRIKHWEILNMARAIENQIFVVNANSCGKANDVIFGGRSSIISPMGEMLVKASSDEDIITAELDFNSIENIRNTLRVFDDRRPELYNIY